MYKRGIKFLDKYNVTDTGESLESMTLKNTPRICF